MKTTVHEEILTSHHKALIIPMYPLIHAYHLTHTRVKAVSSQLALHALTYLLTCTYYLILSVVALLLPSQIASALCAKTIRNSTFIVTNRLKYSHEKKIHTLINPLIT